MHYQVLKIHFTIKVLVTCHIKTWAFRSVKKTASKSLLIDGSFYMPQPKFTGIIT